MLQGEIYFTFVTTKSFSFTCGPHARFHNVETGETYDVESVTCLWNKNWSREKMDHCKSTSKVA